MVEEREEEGEGEGPPPSPPRLRLVRAPRLPTTSHGESSRSGLLYRVTHLLADWLGFLGFGMFHFLAWAAPQLQYSPTACGTSQIEVNPSQVREEMGHPVLSKSFFSIDRETQHAAKMRSSPTHDMSKSIFFRLFATLLGVC